MEGVAVSDEPILKVYDSSEPPVDIDRLRDEFAMAALQGMNANPALCDSWEDDQMAMYAYIQAEAMLQERKKYVSP